MSESSEPNEREVGRDMRRSRVTFGKTLHSSEQARGWLQFKARQDESSRQIDAMWTAVLAAHPQRQHIVRRRKTRPLEAGILYVRNRREIVTVLADSFEAAWNEVFLNEVEVPNNWLRKVIWVPGERGPMSECSPLLHRQTSALSPGRPRRVVDEGGWLASPRRAGIYRIHLVGTDGCPEIYVGRSADLSRRPRVHEKTLGRTWGVSPGNVMAIELIVVRPAGSDSVWTSVDLDEAEAKHIDRARVRERDGGPRVLNATRGRNGPPSRPKVHLFVWAPSI